MAQYNFSEDWDQFFDKLDSSLSNRQNFEKEYNSICRKAKNQEYDNPNSSACYYYMAAILCQFYYNEDPERPQSEKEWAVELGRNAIRFAREKMPDDEEFKTLSLIFELLTAKHNMHNATSLSRKLQSIKRECPHIETIEETLIKPEALRDWFENAYNEILFDLLFDGKVEDDLKLKAELSKELISSPNEVDKELAYAYLADALFDMGNYKEAERYAIMGKDLRGNLQEYNHENDLFWGMCWSIYARCQEEAGDMDYAMTLIEKGASLGIPWCEKELTRLQDEGYCSNEEADYNEREMINYGSLEESCGSKGTATDVQLASNEQDYLDALKDIFDDGEITPRERKMMERLRISLGISEVRAKELEDSLQPQLTKEEQEYLEAYKDACEDGAVSDRSRRILERLRVMYGISEARAREIERL